MLTKLMVITLLHVCHIIMLYGLNSTVLYVSYISINLKIFFLSKKSIPYFSITKYMLITEKLGIIKYLK